MKAEGVIFNIQRYSVHDGPGIRTTVFLKGCPLDCWWCHNPESRDPRPQVMRNEGRCIRCDACLAACPQQLEGVCQRCGACVDACPAGSRQMVGRRMSVSEAMDQIRRDRTFHDQSGGGVTFSGGEPLMQFDFLRELLLACRHEGMHVALDTCGHAPREQVLSAAMLSDLVLYDLKMVDDRKHQKYTGVSNVRILENLRALGKVHRNIWMRIPIIPNVNDSTEDIDSAAAIVSEIKGARRICLLPYHSTGAGKHERMGASNRMHGTHPPDSDTMNRIAARFGKLGLDVTIGG